MKTKFPKLPYNKRIKFIYSELKKKPNKKNILSSIKNIEKKLDSYRKKENDLFYDLGIYNELLMMILLTEAKKSGFKENAKVILVRDNSEHKINVIYFDKELHELCVNLYPPAKVNTLTPIRLSHIKLA